ncbi:MFS transporter [Saccharopolyspora sp. K220]|uniref:MFS transporter n=1 Tax=Saccharopolyspora soli TaxID=2926618 RepID=UPI001F563377|nr:MFS transporter [Saccharopolyspora soli]MCI2415906.1 MFS transporter [Saccharopolyspora soli]
MSTSAETASTHGDSRQSFDDREVRRRCRQALGVTTLGLMLVLVNATSLNVALPAMSASFGVSAATADWFLVAFMLSNTAFILVFGRISDLLGRRSIYLVGLACFTVISLLCAVAPNAPVFIVLRVLQGIAAATTVTNTTPILADVFPPERLVQGMGLNLTAAAVANTIGPALGGLMITFVDWRALFLVNVPFGVAAVVLGARLLPRRPRSRGKRERFDVGGAVLSTFGLAAVLYGINRIGVWGPDDPRVLGAMVFGALLLVLFVLVERRTAAPLLDLQLIRRPGRAQAYGAAFFNSFCRAGVVVLVGLHQQMVEQRSAAVAGIVVLPLALLMMVFSPICGRLAMRWSARSLSSLGALLVLIGLVGLAVQMAAAHLPVGMLLCWLGFVGAGIGLFTAPNTASIMAGVSSNQRAVANGVRSMLYNSAQAAGTVVTLLIVTTWLGTSGITSYAATAGASAVRLGFVVAMATLAASALVALLLSLLRGGSWRTQPATPAASARAE